MSFGLSGSELRVRNPEPGVRLLWYKLWLLMETTPGSWVVSDFAHESEGDLAHLLDFYRIEWYYEPVCFALQRDEQGRVVESFTPDFYLPQFKLYIELTTMKQRLVTKKNRKVRKMRKLYPDCKLKVFYGRDYRRLLFKFGLLR